MEKPNTIYICGSGGTACEVYGILKILNLQAYVKGFVVGNEYPVNGKMLFSVPVMHEENIKGESSVRIVAIGTPGKKSWIQKMEKDGAHFLSVIHPSSIALENIRYGEGVIIYPGVVMTTNITVGDFTIINAGATIGHDSKIGSYCHVAPGVHIAGNVTVGDESWIGIGASISMRVNIGSHVMIGAGAVVVSDIPDNTLAYGVPAKVVRSITEGDWKDLLS